MQEKKRASENLMTGESAADGGLPPSLDNIKESVTQQNSCPSSPSTGADCIPISMNHRFIPRRDWKRINSLVSGYRGFFRSLHRAVLGTLTIERVRDPHRALSVMPRCFSRLRRTAGWQIPGGMWSIEIAVDSGLPLPHNIHLHYLGVAGHIDQDKVRRAWKRITGSFGLRGDSIPWADFVPQEDVIYVLRYILKRPQLPASLLDAVLPLLKGKRLASPFGSLWGRKAKSHSKAITTPPASAQGSEPTEPPKSRLRP